MPAIQSIKSHWFLLPILSLFFLFQTSFANINTLSNAHFCLPNAQGQPPESCTAVVLTKDNVSAFSNFYQNLPALNANWTGASRVVPLPLAATSKTPLNMVDNMVASALDYTIYNPVVYHWRDISKLVYFGGSVSEGQVLLPTPGWIKAAHQNGASILGTIFFSPSVYGGDAEKTQLDYMLTPDASGHYPVADLLISVAKQYGIDGYFINQEAPYPIGKSSQNLADFTNYIEQASKEAGYPIEIEWYFVSGSDGANAFVSDSLFVDYGEWNNSILGNQIAEGYPAAQVEYGIDGFYSSSVPTIPNDASAAMFAFSNILAPDKDYKTAASQQYANAVKFWNAVPEKLRYSNALKYSPMTFFATDFNAGIGDDYYIQGQAQNYGFWSAIGLQDVLPIDLSGNVVKLNFSDSYNGGSLLQATSTTKTVNQKVTLYNNLNIIPENNPVFVVKYKPISGEDPFQVCAHYVDAGNEGGYCLDLTVKGKSTGDGTWIMASTNLPPLSASGYYDAVTLTAPKSVDQVNIGQIFLGDFEAYDKKPDQVVGLQLTQSTTDGNSGMHYIISWEKVASNKYYNVYVNGQFYGATYQNIEDVMVANTENTQICVTPQNYGGITGDSNCIMISPEK